jgi:hypothetical protein
MKSPERGEIPVFFSGDLLRGPPSGVFKITRLNQKGQRYNLDHFTTGAKVYFYRPPSVLDVEKKTRKAKHIDH